MGSRYPTQSQQTTFKMHIGRLYVNSVGHVGSNAKNKFLHDLRSDYRSQKSEITAAAIS